MQLLRSIRLRVTIIQDLLSFLWKERMWWLLPFVGILLLIGGAMFFVQTLPIAPFIYTLF